MEPELLADYACRTGEGPLYHPEENDVYWIDIPEGRLFRYDLDTDEHGEVYTTDVIGGFTIERDGALLLFEGGGRIERVAAGGSRVVFDGIEDEAGSRFNDVIADPEGRVFAGTMPTDDRLGRLYRLDPDGRIDRIADGFDIPNGMGFSPDLEAFYLTASEDRVIYRYDYDRTSGRIADREVFVEVTSGRGLPDGMTVDAEGCVWSARWDGGVLVRYAPDGREVDRIEFPARKVSSVTFGGPDHGQLFVTTAGGDDKPNEGSGAGALFRLRPEVPGRPEFRSAVGGEGGSPVG